MDGIIPDASKSVNEGGIEPLGGEREAYVFNQVQNSREK
jgi:excinuclease ABC subunit A